MDKVKRTINIVDGMKLIVEMDLEVTAEQVMAENKVIDRVLKIKESINKEVDEAEDDGTMRMIDEVRTKRKYDMTNRNKKKKSNAGRPKKKGLYIKTTIPEKIQSVKKYENQTTDERRTTATELGLNLRQYSDRMKNYRNHLRRKRLI